MRRTRAPALALGLCLALAAPAGAQASKEDYSARLEPDDPRAGESVSLIVSAGEGAGRYLDSARIELGEGLEVAGRSTRPRILPSGERGVLLELELKVLAPGPRKVGIVLDAPGGPIRLGPFSFVAAGDERPLSAEAGPRPPTWRWSAPPSVLRYQAFRLALAPIDGPPPEEAEASFGAPAGLSLEPAGDLEWVGIALEEGDIMLPAATVRSGGEAGRAPAASLRVSPLPAALSASRAIGEFEARAEGPYPARPAALSPLRILVTVSGTGNHPAIEPPVPAFYLDGEELPASAASLRRIDEARPGGGAYLGRTALEVELSPPREGLLEARWPPFVTLSASGLRPLQLPPLRARIAAARSRAAAGAGQDPFADAAAAAERLGAALPRLRELPALAAAGRLAEALELLENPGARGGSARADAAYLRAALEWRRGERGLALSLLYGYLRDPGGGSAALRRAEAAAAACGAALGSGPPLLDALPPPRIFFASAAAALAAAAAVASLAMFSRRGGGPSRTGHPSRAAAAGARAAARAEKMRARAVPLALAAVLAAAAAALAGLGAAAAAERSRPYAVVWADRALAVPSEKAERYIPVPRGSTARVRSGAPGYAGIVLADGAAGWVAREALYYY